MKVLFVMHGNNLQSGANLAMQEVIDYLHTNTDIDIDVLFPKIGVSSKEFYEQRNIQVHYSSYHRLLLSKTESYLKRLIKIPLLLLRKKEMDHSCRSLRSLINDVDLIYSNTCTVYFGAMLSKYYHKPHIWHIREYGDKDHNLIFPLGKKIYYGIDRKIDERIVAISKGLKTDLSKYFPEKRIFLIYDDVDPKYDNPKEKLTPLDCYIILIAGDIKPGKGQLEVVQAINILVSRGINNIELLVAGKVGDEAYYKKIVNVIKIGKLEKYVKFLGFVENMNEIRNVANIGVVASPNEGFGRVTIEGMLSNMVMIGKNAGGTSELIQNGYNGLLYNGGAEELANAIASVVSNESYYLKLSLNGYRYGKEYIQGNCAEKVAALIYETVGGNK